MSWACVARASVTELFPAEIGRRSGMARARPKPRPAATTPPSTIEKKAPAPPWRAGADAWISFCGAGCASAAGGGAASLAGSACFCGSVASTTSIRSPSGWVAGSSVLFLAMPGSFRHPAGAVLNYPNPPKLAGSSRGFGNEPGQGIKHSRRVWRTGQFQALRRQRLRTGGGGRADRCDPEGRREGAVLGQQQRAAG